MLRQLQVLPRHVTVDPNDAVTAHDRVHRIGLLRERRGIRGRDLRPGEVVEAALAVRVAVDDHHADGGADDAGASETLYQTPERSDDTWHRREAGGRVRRCVYNSAEYH